MIDLPETKQWYIRQRVDDTVTLVTEPHVHRFLRCNVWHVRGRDRDVVIDTALGVRPLRHLVERELPGDLLAVATHAHSDHIGGMHEFGQRAIHSAEAERLVIERTACVETEWFGAVIRPYRDAGYEFGDLLIDALPSGGLAATAWEVAPAPATWVLAEGDIVDLGDRAFEVLHLPGHSPGSIGLWEASTGILFSGDAVYDGPLLDELDGSSIEDYVATMRRLRALPVTVVHGGHEASFGRERLVEICDAYLAHAASAR